VVKELEQKIAKGAGYGILAALCYALSGNCYNAIKQTIIFAGISGHNNRILNGEFYTEFENERQALEARLKQNDKDKPGVEVSLSLYVNPMLKYFYDDANDLNDNEEWAKEVEKAVSGLGVFENLGYDFKIGHVYAVPPIVDSAEFYSSAYFIYDNYNTDDFNISFVTNPAQKLSMMERIDSKVVFGRAFIGGSYGAIYMTNDTGINTHTLAHETGHMFGLDDEEIEKWKRIIDPNCFFFIRLMSQGSMCENYSLNEKELSIIDKAKERFL